jgi:hypothetical protein
MGRPPFSPPRVCSVPGCGKKHKAKGFCNTHHCRLYSTGTLEPGIRPRGSQEDRFWLKVRKSDGCWEWIGSKRPNGYGRFQAGGRGTSQVAAHRFSYELHKGRIPDGLVVMHRCDNRTCVNPDHLSLGTPLDNTRDMYAKGRANPGRPRGNLNANAKLTPEAVRYIRSSFKYASELARELGVGQTSIRSVRSGRTWSHID